MLLPDKDNPSQSDSDEPHQVAQQVVFIKPMVKQFASGEQTIYMILTDKGRSLAVFDSLKACRHFAIRNRLDLHFAH